MKKYLEYAGLVILTLVLAYLFLPAKKVVLGSATGYDSLNLTPSSATGDTYSIAVAGNSIVDMSGNYLGTQTGNIITPSLIVGSSTNTAFTHMNCATSSWNPGAVGSSTDQSIDVFVPGYIIGDNIVASIATSTQGLAVMAVSTSSLTGTTTAVLFDTDNAGAAVDISTTTIKVCDLN